jgi:two-component system LytT family response regulator
MKIRSLIIDDDPFIRDLLKDKLDQYVDDVEIVGMAASGAEGAASIAEYNPDLVFLDVEMADMTGFEMLASLENITFQTIFITAFNHYAIKAIRFNALDYLVKPIDLGELRSAMDRYREMVAQNESSSKVQHAISNMKAENIGDEILTLQMQDGELSIQLKEIILLEGERNYSTIHTDSGAKNLTSKTLGHFEDLLSEKGFFRCHKSHLVNAQHIAEVKKVGSVILSNGEEIQVSRRKFDTFKTWLAENQ